VLRCKRSLLRVEDLTVTQLAETRTGGRQTLPPYQQMKTTNSQNAALSETLHAWQVSASLRLQFRDGVWRRIAQEEAKSNITLFAVLNAWVESVLPRPKIALCYVSALLLVGMASGLWAAQGGSHRMNADLGSRYMQSVDPYYTVTPN
jgi:hypothetical protein